MNEESMLEREGADRHGVQRAGGLRPERRGPGSATLWSDARRRFVKNRLAMVGLVVVVIFAVLALFAPLLAPYDPIMIDSSTLDITSLRPPSIEHPMGTDISGRDLLSRLIWGSRASLVVGLVAAGIMIVAGLVLGAIAGFYGKSADAVIMRTADIFFAFPYVLGAILLITIMGRGLTSTSIAIGLLGWPTIARMFRSSVIAVTKKEYVEAARALGASDFRLITRHVLPNSIAPVIVYGTMSVGGVIIAEAALSFLGLGVQPPTPAWGYMLADSRSYFTTAPWLMWFPGLAITLTVLGFMLLGDGIRDAIDPKTKID